MSEGESTHLGWVRAHPSRARWNVKEARTFIWPKAASAPIYSYHRGRLPRLTCLLCPVGLHQSRLSEVLDGTRREEAGPKARGLVNRMLNGCWTIIHTNSSDEVAYIETLRKHRDRVWVKCTIIEARDLLLVPHILARAVEGQDKARGLLFLVPFRDMNEKLALDAVTL